MGTHKKNGIGAADWQRLTKSQRRSVVREEAERLSCLRHIKSEKQKGLQKREQILTLEVAEHYSRFGLPHCADPGGGGFRGKVREFSRAARRRLILDFGKLKTYPSCWLTLTFADDCMAEKTVSERSRYSSLCLKRWSEWLEYHYQGVWAVWRKEWEVRKSGKLKGELCPHYHVMIEYGFDAEKSLMAMRRCLKRWVRQTGTKEEVAMKVAMRPESRAILNGKEMAQRYVSKYMSKTTLAIFEGMEEEETLGRYWGRIGNPPYGPVWVLRLDRHESIWLRRLMNRLCRGKRAQMMKKKLRQGVGWVFASRKTVSNLLAWIVAQRDWGPEKSDRHILAQGGNMAPF